MKEAFRQINSIPAMKPKKKARRKRRPVKPIPDLMTQAQAAEILCVSRETRDVAEFVQRIDPIHGVVALALLLLQNELATRRWTVVLSAFVVPPGHFRMLRIQYLALFAQLFLPASIGGAFVRAGMIVRAGVPFGAATYSVILDRIVAAGGLMALAVVFIPVVAVPWRFEGTPWLALLAGCTAAAALAVSAYAARRPLVKWAPVRRLLGPIEQAAASFASPARIAVALAWSLAGQLVTVAAVFVLASGLDLNISLVDCLVTLPPVMLISALPISISGWGVREGAMVVGLGLLGVPKEAALVLSVQFALTGYLAATPGAFAWLMETSGARNKPASGCQG